MFPLTHVYFWFRFEGVYVAGDIQVELVFFDLGQRGGIGILIHLFEVVEGPDDLVDILLAEAVLVFDILVLTAGVDEQDVFIAVGTSPVPRLAGFVKDYDGGWDASTEEQVGRQADDGIEDIVLDKLLANLALGSATEQYTMRDDIESLPTVAGANVVASPETIATLKPADTSTFPDELASLAGNWNSLPEHIRSAINTLASV